MKRKFRLSRETIVEATDFIEQYLSNRKVDHKDVIRNRMIAEEIRIGWLEKLLAFYEC